MDRKLLLRRLLPLLIIVLAGTAFAYMKSSKPERKKPVASEKVWQVDVIQAESRSLAPGLTLHGEVESPSLIKSAAPGAGLVSEVLVRPGQTVIPGQRLVAMDRRDFSAARIQASAEVTDLIAQLDELRLRNRSNQQVIDQEKALLELATVELKRVERLKKNNLSSESALSDAHEKQRRQQLSLIAKQLAVDLFLSSQKQLQARLSRARAQLADVELSLMRSEVSAEFSAIIASMPVSVGDRVRVADTLVSLYPLDSLEVRARIPAAYQSEIQQALARGMTLSAVAEASGKRYPLELLRLAGEARADGIDAYFRVIEGTADLRIGNLLTVQLKRPQQHRVFAVPYRAVYGNNRLYLLRENRMVSISVEAVGQYRNDEGAVQLLVRSSDIVEGDRIITTHLSNALDGLKVSLVDAKDPS